MSPATPGHPLDTTIHVYTLAKLVDTSKGVSVSSASAHHRVADALRADIRAGRWAAGDQLPSEQELTRVYGVSRTTIRQALGILANTNLVRRQQGKGTFVAEQGISHLLGDLRSFTQVMLDLGMTPNIREVSIHPDTQPPPAASAFLPGSRLWLAQRTRTSGSRPFCFMKSWLPDAIGAAFDEEQLIQRQSLYGLLQDKLSVIPREAIEVIRAEAAQSDEAHALDISFGHPVLAIYRWTSDHRGQPIEYVRSVSPGDRYEYVAKLQQ